MPWLLRWSLRLREQSLALRQTSQSEEEKAVVQKVELLWFQAQQVIGLGPCELTVLPRRSGLALIPLLPGSRGCLRLDVTSNSGY